jgi:hypothetical protein
MTLVHSGLDIETIQWHEEGFSLSRVHAAFSGCGSSDSYKKAPNGRRILSRIDSCTLRITDWSEELNKEAGAY